ncbi:MAG: hypothetical protein HY314_13880 [Acidobacteria bacterium]|nr:hypothetical protein [Acidobacteriota bacterium]
MFILDTNHVSLFQRNNPHVSARVLATPPLELATTIITVEEQVRGRLDRVRRARSDKQIVRAYHNLLATVLYFLNLILRPRFHVVCKIQVKSQPSSARRYADRQQQREFLETAMRSFEGEFSGTIQDILSTFRPAPRLHTDTPEESYIAGVFTHWRSTAKQPQLIGTVSIGTAEEDGSMTFLRLRPQDGKFEEHAWPASLEIFCKALQQRSHARRDPPPFPPAEVVLTLSEDRPVIVLRLLTITFHEMRPPSDSRRPPGPPFSRGPFPPPRPPQEQEPPPAPGSRPFMRRPLPSASRGARPHTQLTGWCFLEFDPAFLQNNFLPGLVERHFGGGELSKYQLAVVTGNPSRILYKSTPALTSEALSSFDAMITLFSQQAQFASSIMET